MNRVFSLGLVVVFLFCGCAGPSSQPSAKNSNFTHGKVQLTLKKGVTTQAEVVEIFGAPNVATIDGQGNEVWTYQKHATVSRSSEGYATILLAGASARGFEQSSRNMTLIIKFDASKVVADFNSMYSSF
jgi:outer membrane protein assembly factor BamE (lipoprotein component of BamABCDE complex)